MTAINYRDLYMGLLRHSERIESEIAILKEENAVAKMSCKNATIRTVAMEKRIAELERRIQGLESR